MGFDKSKISNEVRVPMRFHVVNKDTRTEEDADVVHVFRYPSVSDREEYQRKLVRLRGRKIKSGSVPDANFSLWQSCIIRVEGYDNINNGSVESLAAYFNDDIGRIHVDEAIDRLMEMISAEEVDEEKKFAPSSEASSGSVKT